MRSTTTEKESIIFKSVSEEMFEKLTSFNCHLKFLKSSPFQIQVFFWLIIACLYYCVFYISYLQLTTDRINISIWATAHLALP